MDLQSGAVNEVFEARAETITALSIARDASELLSLAQRATVIEGIIKRLEG